MEVGGVESERRGSGVWKEGSGEWKEVDGEWKEVN